MAPVLGALLASLWIGYHTPTLLVSFALLSITVRALLGTVVWWALLIEIAVGLGVSLLAVRSFLSREHMRVFRLLPGLGIEPADMVDFLVALLASVLFGSVYIQERPLNDLIPIREYGAPTALVLAFACLSLSYVAKQFWFQARSYEPGALRVLVEVSALILVVDLMIWGAKAPTRMGAGAVLAVRYLVWLLHRGK